jgi:hypothetical protein
MWIVSLLATVAALVLGAAPQTAANRPVARLPLELRIESIIVPIFINGEGPFNMILDTGMPMDGVSVIIPGLEDRLGIRYTETATVHGVGEEPPRTAEVGYAEDVTIGGVSFGAQAVIELPMNFPMLTSYIMNDIDGIVGYMVFSRYLVGLDFTAGEVSFYHHDSFRAEEGYLRMRLVVRENIPYIDAEVTTANHDHSEVRLAVDTGAAAQPLLLYRNRAKGFSPGDDAERVIIGRGFAGDLWGYWSRVRELTIDRYTLYRVLAALPEKKRHAAGRNAMIDGILGIGALERFDLVFDYRNGRLYLRPNAAFSEPFEPPRIDR